MSFITIGKLAKACDVKTDTVRYYENQDLLTVSGRTEAGYRLYGSETIDRLRFIKRAQALGFTLKEIKDLLQLSDKPEADCEDVRQRAQQKIAEIEQRIADLNEIKKSLHELSVFCPGKGKPLNECNILRYFYDSSH